MRSNLSTVDRLVCAGLLELLEHPAFDFGPVMRAGWSLVPIGGVSEDDHFLAGFAKGLDVRGAVLDVNIGVDGGFFGHEAQIPVRDAVLLEPFDGLEDGLSVKPGNVQTMGDDADSDASRGNASQG